MDHENTDTDMSTEAAGFQRLSFECMDSMDCRAAIGQPALAATSPTNPLSRTSSLGSLGRDFHQASSSSPHNSEDNDDDSDNCSNRSEQLLGNGQRRREAHLVAEQKRRDAIKKGYHDLQTLVPILQSAGGSADSHKISKSIVLQKAIEYMNYLLCQKQKQEEELDKLRKEVLALQIMKKNIEDMAAAASGSHFHQSGDSGQALITDEIKMAFFRKFMDAQFESFDSTVSCENFTRLSASTFAWIEQFCTPLSLREASLKVFGEMLPESAVMAAMQSLSASPPPPQQPPR